MLPLRPPSLPLSSLCGLLSHSLDLTTFPLLPAHPCHRSLLPYCPVHPCPVQPFYIWQSGIPRMPDLISGRPCLLSSFCWFPRHGLSSVCSVPHSPPPALSPPALPTGCLDPWAFCVSPDLSLECPPSRMSHACPLPVIRVSGQMSSSERQNSFSHNTASILKLLNSLTMFPLSTYSNEGLGPSKTA